MGGGTTRLITSQKLRSLQQVSRVLRSSIQVRNCGYSVLICNKVHLFIVRSPFVWATVTFKCQYLSVFHNTQHWDENGFMATNKIFCAHCAKTIRLGKNHFKQILAKKVFPGFPNHFKCDIFLLVCVYFRSTFHDRF